MTRLRGRRNRREFLQGSLVLAGLGLLAGCGMLSPGTQPANTRRVPSVGVISQGGPWNAVADGLREGLAERGLVEGEHFSLDLRDAGGDPESIKEAARSLEREQVALIYAVATS